MQETIIWRGTIHVNCMKFNNIRWWWYKSFTKPKWKNIRTNYWESFDASLCIPDWSLHSVYQLLQIGKDHQERKIKEQWSQQCYPRKLKRWVTSWSPLGKWNRKSHTIWLMSCHYLLDWMSKLKQQEVEEYLPRVTPKNCTTINRVPSPHLQTNKIYHGQYIIKCHFIYMKMGQSWGALTHWPQLIYRENHTLILVFNFEVKVSNRNLN